MESSEYLHVLHRRWRTVTGIALLAVLIAVTVTALLPRTYTATTQAFVSTPSTGNASELLQGNNFTQQRVRSYADIVSTPVVLDTVIEELGLDTTSRSLASRVWASSPPETVLIDISVKDSTPGDAAEIANAIAQSFASRIGELEAPADGSASPVRVSIVQPAETPQAPTSPDPIRNIGVALVLGLLAGFGLAVVRHRLDTVVSGESDIRGITDTVVLGGIAEDPQAKSSPLVVQQGSQSPRAEAFRQLRTNLQFVDVADHLRSIVITSSVPGEGKTTTAINLAVTLAAAGRRVCLVDADLRRPKAAEYMGLEPAVGLTTVLIGRAELDDVLQPWGPDALDVLPVGDIPPNPSELLASEAMEAVLHRLEERYDVVLIDAPPLLPVTDAVILSRLADGALLVAGCGRVERQAVVRAISSLEAVHARILGMVLNMLPRERSPYESYGYDDRPKGTVPGPRHEVPVTAS